MEKFIKKINRDLGSLLQESKMCFICGKLGEGLHKHHIFYGTANRKVSDEDLMCVYLCPQHHNMSSQGVHFNKDLDLKLKQHAEKIWLEHYTDKDLSMEERINMFIKRYGKNYL